MINALSKVKTYSKGFIDATLIAVIVVMVVAYVDQKEQESLIQRFGWPKTQIESKKYSKIPKGKPVSTQQPTNPIGFC